MGEFTTTQRLSIKPTEKGFDIEKLKVLIPLFQMPNLYIFPIIVRPDTQRKGTFLTIDGRNRMILHELYGTKKIPIYVAHHKKDYIRMQNPSPIERQAMIRANGLILSRFDSVQENRHKYYNTYAQHCDEYGISSLNDLETLLKNI
ncbi:MAG: hypothetical protein ACMXYK_05080 [Candidatus Woesearchaeota archaeon]